MENNKLKITLGILRLSMGLMFLWAFFDKVFGLGFATKPADAWLAGGSPTTGFLKFAVNGPFINFFHSLAGSGLVDLLFMLGLLTVGVTLTFGIAVRFGAYVGATMLFLMYLAVGMPPVNHPFIDDHFINFFVMLVLAFSNPGAYLGFGNTWARSEIAQKFPIFK